MTTDDLLDLERLLRESDGDTLLAILRDRAHEIDPPRAMQALRNPFAGREAIAALMEVKGLTASYELRLGLVLHPQTPEARAVQWVTGLYWKDLVRVGTEPRVRPVIRRAADLALGRRLPGLAMGEKIAIARRAGSGVLAALALDPSPRVWAALLENPRLTEGALAPVTMRDTTPPLVLAAIADSRKWGRRLSLRTGLSRNPRTPEEKAMRILPLLSKGDLREVARDPRLPASRRKRARLLLGDVD